VNGFCLPPYLQNFFLKKNRFSDDVSNRKSGHAHRTFTHIYIEALLVDEEAADQVWEAWDARTLNNGAACIAWMLIAGLISPNDQHLCVPIFPIVPSRPKVVIERHLEPLNMTNKRMQRHFSLRRSFQRIAESAH
jgi:hypothetical protein